MFFHVGLFEDASLGVHDFALMVEYRDGSSVKVALYNMDDVGGVVTEKAVSSADGYSVETWTSLDGFDFKVVKYLDGVQHCEDGPAVVVHDDMNDSHVLLFRAYYVRGMLHRTDGPAVEGFHRNGAAAVEEWYRYDKPFRDGSDVVAVEYDEEGQVIEITELSDGVLRK